MTLLTNADCKIVLSSRDQTLISRIVAVAHQGNHAHMSPEVTLQVVKDVFTWPTMCKDVKSWVTNRLSCIKLAGDDLMPRPWDTNS